MNRCMVALAAFAAVFVTLAATGRASIPRLEGAALQVPTQGMAGQPLSRLADPYETELPPTTSSDLNGWRQQISEELSPRAYLPLVVAGKGTPCFRWYGQIALQDAVNQYPCVEIQAGTWTTTVQISMPASHVLSGQGMDRTILKAVEPWIGNGQNSDSEAVIHNNGQPDVVIRNLTIDANNTSTDGIGAHGRNMTIDSVRVKNAKCDGIAVAAAGWVVQNSLIESNGLVCPTGLPGGGIYVIRQEYDDGIYSPKILKNHVLGNGGPAIDIDGVHGGLISGNIIRDNRAWAAISLNAGRWTISDNDISHPQGADPTHRNHPECSVKHANNLSAGISVCHQIEQSWVAGVQNNVIASNRISAGHGIRLMGADETYPEWIPRFNIVKGNDLTGSIVGCIDDFEPGQNLGGLNLWEDNNCTGNPNTPPVYLWRLCPNSVSSATVASWQLGEAAPSVVQAQIDAFNANRLDGGAFAPGDLLPAGALVATDFDPSNSGAVGWEDYPVETVVRSGSWGLFRAVTAYTAPQPGACLLVFP